MTNLEKQLRDFKEQGKPLKYLINYMLSMEQYDENVEALNLQIKNESSMNSYMTYKLDIHSIYKTERGNNYDYTQNYCK